MFLQHMFIIIMIEFENLHIPRGKKKLKSVNCFPMAIRMKVKAGRLVATELYIFV